jgi:hemerythrin superfamily protein
MPTTTADIVALLENDHRQVERLLAQMGTVAPAERGDLFAEVMTTVVRHETAEELVVYPAIHADAPNGPEEADARIKEQAETEELLTILEKLDPVSEAFVAQFGHLRIAFLAHANAEEDRIFPLLVGLADTAMRQRMAERYEKAKASAPTRPHPAAPDTPPLNRVVGPITSLFDKARDALSDRR